MPADALQSTIQEPMELKINRHISNTKKATKSTSKKKDEYSSPPDSDRYPIYSQRINKKPLGLTELLQDEIPEEQVTIRSIGKEEHLSDKAFCSRAFHQLDTQKSANEVIKMENHIKQFKLLQHQKTSATLKNSLNSL